MLHQVLQIHNSIKMKVHNECLTMVERKSNKRYLYNALQLYPSMNIMLENSVPADTCECMGMCLRWRRKVLTMPQFVHHPRGEVEDGGGHVSVVTAATHHAAETLRLAQQDVRCQQVFHQDLQHLRLELSLCRPRGVLWRSLEWKY